MFDYQITLKEEDVGLAADMNVFNVFLYELAIFVFTNGIFEEFLLCRVNISFFY